MACLSRSAVPHRVPSRIAVNIGVTEFTLEANDLFPLVVQGDPSV